MSVIITLVGKGDPQKLEAYAADNSDSMGSIVDNAKRHGLRAHRFYGSDDGQIMVVDEWPDADSFHAFFGETQDRIRPLMEGAGMTSEPTVTVWRKLDTHDEVGWEELND